MASRNTTAVKRKAMLGRTKWFSFDVQDNGSSMSSQSSMSRGGGMDGRGIFLDGRAASPFGLGLELPPPTQQFSTRRGSFLFRSESEDCADKTLSGSGSSSRLTSLIAGQLPETHFEELIVTPFAQILQRLQAARSSYIQLTNVTGNSCRRTHVNNTTDKDISSTSSSGPGTTGVSNNTTLAPPPPPPQSQIKLPDEATKELAVDILNDLDWCLERLETVHTHRSVSDMATTKFKRLLNKELNQLAVSSKSGSLVSEYITNTFLDKDEEAEGEQSEHGGPAGSEGGGNAGGQGSKPDRRCHTTSMMSRISGIRRLNHSTSQGPDGSIASAALPTYGVANIADSVLEEPISKLDQWGIDIFSLDSLTSGRSLVTVTYTILKERNLITKFHLSPRTLLTYLAHVEDHYRNVPYHNHLHAADVTQSIHALLSLPSLQTVFTDLEVLAVIFAGAVHDVDHPGVTNQYLINTSSELALMYNDESVLENHHLAVAFKLLQNDSCDVFKPLVAKSRQRLRRMVIDLVLATDMSKHMSLLADLKTMVETKKVTGSGALLVDNYTDRMQVLQNMIHCADLSNPTKPLYLYRQWTDRIMQEFFEQGDIERELGLDISPMCDRHRATVEKSQVGFIDFIVQPLWETWADLVHPYCSELLDVLEDNREWYNSRIATSPSSSSSSSGHRSSQCKSPTSPDETTPNNPSIANSNNCCHDNDNGENFPTDDDEDVNSPTADAELIASRHPDGVHSPSNIKSLAHSISTASGTSSVLGVSQDCGCRHPEMIASPSEVPDNDLQVNGMENDGRNGLLPGTCCADCEELKLRQSVESSESTKLETSSTTFNRPYCDCPN